MLLSPSMPSFSKESSLSRKLKRTQVELDVCPNDEPNKEEIFKTVGEP